MKILTKLQNIDRRILYVLIALVIIVPLIKRPSQHPAATSETLSAYKTIKKIPQDKIAIISIVWSASTVAENGPQTEAMMRHLFKRHIRFAVLAWDQVGNEMTYQMGNKIAAEMGKKYGVDWVHLGYRVPYVSIILRGMANNFPGTLKYDYNKTPIGKIPMLKGVSTHKDIGAVVEVTPSATMEIWVAYFNGPNHIPLIYCPTAVMSAEAYPYLNSGQIAGMLNGVMGAAQYEGLIGMGDKPTDAARYMWALSSANVLIIILIVLGNLEYFMAKRNGRRNRGGGGNA